MGSTALLGRTIGKAKGSSLTPFAAHCIGFAFATIVTDLAQPTGDDATVICIGRDPRPHGAILADAFARGAEAASKHVRAVYTGIATTPSMFEFCRYVTPSTPVAAITFLS